MDKLIKHDKEILKDTIRKYINIIKCEFKDYVKIDDNIDFDKIIHIQNTNTVSLFVRDNEFYFPKEIYGILDSYKENDLFGSDKHHKTYTNESLIENNNTFYDYIDHIIKAGLTPLQYFQEILLHEVLHFCGSGGASAIREGLNEYLTRIVALKYDLITNGCAYPKELKIILELEKTFGFDILLKIAFSKSNQEIKNILNKLGSEYLDLYSNVNNLMQEEFNKKYYQYNFSGNNGPYLKAKLYDSIDYSKTYELIEKTLKLKKIH